MKKINVTINYLDNVEVESGRVADPNDGTYNGSSLQSVRWTPRVATRAVDPTVVNVSVTDDRIATITCDWGDRVERGSVPPIHGTLTDGQEWSLRGDQLWIYGDEPSIDGHYSDDDDLINSALDARRQVTEAWLRDIGDRPDVATVVEHYRQLTDEIDRKYQQLDQRDADIAAAIAEKLRRKKVEIGAQVVPGVFAVRSTRGTLLGYVDLWGGRWDGKIERP